MTAALDSSASRFAKLAGIKKEVDEFHPVLAELFRNMPGIKSVEYKQGPSEKGADFVLVKDNEILGDEEYVGVVVKVGQITQASVDVERQIEECQLMPRVVGGKKQVRLSEVWVVTNVNITNNAQEKFSYKYASTKVKFISGEKLADLITKHLPRYWDDVSLQVGTYFSQLRDSLGLLNKQVSLSPMPGLEVELPQELIRIEGTKYKDASAPSKKRRTLAPQDVVEQSRISFIEGTMGAGKSRLLRTLAMSYADTKRYQEEKIVPIYITFKEFEAEYDLSVSRVVELTGARFGISFDGVIAVIFLDGLDETRATHDARIQAISQISDQLQEIHSVRVVVAGRPVDDRAVEAVVDAGLKRYRIAPLSLKSIIKMLETTCSKLNLKARLIEDLKKSSLFKVIPKTPIAALLLARLFNENLQDLPANLTELYAKYTELSLGRWDALNGRAHQQKEYETLEKVVSKLARYMVDNDLPEISVGEARGIFKSYLQDRNLGIDADLLFDHLAKRCDLIYVNEQRGTVSFKHKTFAEFFYAKTLSDGCLRDLGETAFDMRWGTIVFFYLGLRKDCGDILAALSQTVPSVDRTRILKMLNMGNLMLAGYQSEYAYIEKCLADSFREAAIYYCELVNGSIESRLRSLSQMHLLYLFRVLLDDAYSYEFFKPAMESAMLLLEQDAFLADDVKAVSLFLLNTSYVSVGGEDAYAFLVERISAQKLPLPVQLAIKHEAKDRDINNDAVKRVHRNVRKILSKNKGMQQKIKELYERRLDSRVEKGGTH